MNLTHRFLGTFVALMSFALVTIVESKAEAQFSCSGDYTCFSGTYTGSTASTSSIVGTSTDAISTAGTDLGTGVSASRSPLRSQCGIEDC
jgi:hypothetical protein